MGQRLAAEALVVVVVRTLAAVAGIAAEVVGRLVGVLLAVVEAQQAVVASGQAEPTVPVGSFALAVLGFVGRPSLKLYHKKDG